METRTQPSAPKRLYPSYYRLLTLDTRSSGIWRPVRTKSSERLKYETVILSLPVNILKRSAMILSGANKVTTPTHGDKRNASPDGLQ
eukprot:6200393-Pleurochrysis_carterae.AAC.2